MLRKVIGVILYIDYIFLFYCPLKERLLFYNTIIKQLMMYGSCVWSTTKGNLKRVFRLQKIAGLVILDSDFSTRTVLLFKKIDWIPFYVEVKITKALIIYKTINNNCPTYLIDMLKKNSEVTTHFMHSAMAISISFVRNINAN